MLTLVPVGNVLSVVLLSEERWEIGEADLRLHFAVLCLSFVAFVGLLWAIRVLTRQRRLEQEALSARMNEAYYEAMEQQHFEIRRLRHDMANHLQALAALPPEEKDAYIRELLDSGTLARTLKLLRRPDDQCGAVCQRKPAAPAEHFPGTEPGYPGRTAL